MKNFITKHTSFLRCLLKKVPNTLHLGRLANPLAWLVLAAFFIFCLAPEALYSQPKELGEREVERLTHLTPYMKKFSAEGISPDFEPLAEAAKNHPQYWVREDALFLLSILFPKRAKGVFVFAVKNESDNRIKGIAANSLVKLKDPLGKIAIKEILKDPEIWDRFKISYIQTLAETGDHSEYAFALKAVKSEDWLLRMDCVSALIAFLDYEITELNPHVDPFEELLKLSKDPHPQVRLNVISQLFSSGKRRDKVKEILKRLNRGDPNEEVRSAAKYLLSDWDRAGTTFQKTK